MAGKKPNNWQNVLTRPQSWQLKGYLAQILKERFPKHEDLLDRVSVALVTTQDVENFSRMIVDIYEVAYLKCVSDHAKALERAGCKAIIKPGGIAPSEQPIFQEKSG